MKLAVRKIYYKAVTPSCEIIDLDYNTWMQFLHGSNENRKKIVCQATNKMYMYDYTKEIAWFPLNDQNCLKEVETKN